MGTSSWFVVYHSDLVHDNDVIMSTIASQITGVSIVCSTIGFGRGSKKISKFWVTGLCAANSPVTGELSAQKASNAENVSIWRRYHVAIECTHIHQHHCSNSGTSEVNQMKCLDASREFTENSPHKQVKTKLKKTMSTFNHTYYMLVQLYISLRHNYMAIFMFAISSSYKLNGHDQIFCRWSISSNL